MLTGAAIGPYRRSRLKVPDHPGACERRSPMMEQFISCRFALLIGLILLGTGCANITTLDRRTELPARAAKEPEGLAIHLDAKQRLVFSGPRGVCAEPSPDALSAVASSFGAGISVPSQGAGSVAQALQESAASIGLRTQSITL